MTNELAYSLFSQEIDQRLFLSYTETKRPYIPIYDHEPQVFPEDATTIMNVAGPNSEGLTTMLDVLINNSEPCSFLSNICCDLEVK